jgi:hypothetical protein
VDLINKVFMKREEEIKKQSEIYSNDTANYVEWGDGWEDYNDIEYVERAFMSGVKWADEHPDNKYTYTKQQLIDMGFAFTTNGDIVTPDQLNEDLKNYLKHQKQKFIEQACEWLDSNFPSIDGVGSWYKESFINRFKKVAEL